jgi:uncharacterized membrane protein
MLGGSCRRSIKIRMKVKTRRVSVTTEFLRHAKNVQPKLGIQNQSEHSVVTFYV